MAETLRETLGEKISDSYINKLRKAGLPVFDVTEIAQNIGNIFGKEYFDEINEQHLARALTPQERKFLRTFSQKNLATVQKEVEQIIKKANQENIRLYPDSLAIIINNDGSWRVAIVDPKEVGLDIHEIDESRLNPSHMDDLTSRNNRISKEFLAILRDIHKTLESKDTRISRISRKIRKFL
jgi:hypothetical protein